MPDTQIKDGWNIRPSFFSKSTPFGYRQPILLLSWDVPDTICIEAEKSGCHVIRLPKWNRLSSPICGHPDMLCTLLPAALQQEEEVKPSLDGCSAVPTPHCENMHSFKSARFVPSAQKRENKRTSIDSSSSLLLPEEYYLENTAFWNALNYPLCLTHAPFGSVYPEDICLNLLPINGSLFGRLDRAAPELIAAYPHRIHVNQGYTRCSVLKLSEQAAITADKGLAAALSENGINVLCIQPGHIRLKGYNYGFIGGASFLSPDGTVCFFGNFHNHPDASSIEAFAADHRIRLRSLGNEKLTDYGGGVLLL